MTTRTSSSLHESVQTPVWQRLLAVAVAFVMLAGCGISVNDAPLAIGDASLPDDLITTELADEPIVVDNLSNLLIFMVGGDDRLVGVPRIGLSAPIGVTRQLELGTRTGEAEVGITTAISRSAGVASVDPVDPATGLWHVTLTEGNRVAETQSEQVLAYAQIVYTLTELDGVDRLVFFDGEEPLAVPTNVGTAIPGQFVDRSFFAEVGPRVPAFPVEGDAPIELETAPLVPPVTVPTPVPAARVEPLAIWLVNGDGLLARYSRQVVRQPEALLESMFLGPSIAEQQIGVRSAVLSNALATNLDVALSVDDEPGVAVLDLAGDSLPQLIIPLDETPVEELTDDDDTDADTADDDTGSTVLNNNDRLLAVAQIVYTLTELAEIGGVRILIDGLPNSMPTQDGLSGPDEVLTRSLYSNFSSLNAVEPLPEAVPEELPTATPITPTPVPTPTPG